MKRRSVAGAGTGGEVNIPVPAGVQVQSVRVDGGRVVLHVKGAGREEILIVDTAPWQYGYDIAAGAALSGKSDNGLDRLRVGYTIADM